MQIEEKIQEYQERWNKLSEEAADVCQEIRELNSSVDELTAPYRSEEAQKKISQEQLDELAVVCVDFEDIVQIEYARYLVYAQEDTQLPPSNSSASMEDHKTLQRRVTILNEITSQQSLSENPSWEDFQAFQTLICQWQETLNRVQSEITAWDNRRLVTLERRKSRIVQFIDGLPDMTEEAIEE